MKPSLKHVVIVGATSAIAEHCARLWVKKGVGRMTLIARDAAKAERIAADLRVRGPSTRIVVTTTSFTDAPTIDALARSLAAELTPDLVLIAHGSLPDQALCESDRATTSDALLVNGVSPALFAEAFAAIMTVANAGHLVLIGSVAGDRGRKSNYVYGAAKGLIDRYAQGLQHRFANSGVVVTIVKPGPTDTPMTAHLKGGGTSLASVDEVAKAIVDGVDRDRPVIYAPGKWALIMLVIRHLPRVVFNRMNI